MDIGLYEAVSGMKAQAAYQDSIAANLARVNIPGNKQLVTAFEIPGESDLQKTTDATGTVQQMGIKGAPMQSRTAIDFTPGLLEETKDPTNFAIEGQGFFKVREANGDISYTRNGQFHLNTQGVLVTTDGAQVLLQNDVPLNLNPKDNNQITIQPDGKVLAGPNHTPRGSLALVHAANDPKTKEPIDPRTLFTQAPNGRFTLAKAASEGNEAQNADAEGRVAGKATASQLQPGLPANGVIRQGFLEQSNSDSVTAMVNLVQVVRSYEANQKMVQEEDSATGKMIDAVSNT